MPPLSICIALVAIVTCAFVAEASIGFGATVITVTLAVLFVPITTILPAFVPINMLLSVSILLRNHEAVQLRLLARKIAPAVVVGLAAGLWAFRHQKLEALALGFSIFVVVLSLVELIRARRGSDAPAPLRREVHDGLLVLGGFVHGLFGAGGPMIVYVLQRHRLDKRSFRASLALVWLVLNAMLVANYTQLGLLGRQSLALSATLALPLLPALWIGEFLHHRLSPRRFQLGIFTLLLIAGLALGVRTALKLVLA